MGSVLGDFVTPTPPVLTLYLPRGRRGVDHEFLAAELRRLGAGLSAVSGIEPDDAAWQAAFAAEEAGDRALAELYDHRENLNIGDRRFYEIVRSREFLPAEQFAELAATVPSGTPPSGVGLMLSGIVAEPLDLFDHLAAFGARVVADDFAGGTRRRYPTATADDPFERLAAAMLGGPPDPTRGDPIARRARHLAETMDASRARGLVIYDPTFCEPELFDVPLLRRHLGDAGYPVLHLEMELTGAVSQQTLTRLEAFVETLS
jgi:hypothetical protein